MDSDSFSEIVLTGSEVRLLKKLSHGAEIPFDDNNCSHVGLDSFFLIEDTGSVTFGLADTPDGTSFITASEKGKRYLLYRREDRFRHRWPVYLSIAAAVIALAALVKSFFF